MEREKPLGSHLTLTLTLTLPGVSAEWCPPLLTSCMAVTDGQ